MDLRPGGGYLEAGQTSARAQIHHERASGAVFGSETAADGNETVGVPQLRAEGTGAEEAGATGIGEDIAQRNGRGDDGGVIPLVDRGAGHRRSVSPRAR